MTTILFNILFIMGFSLLFLTVGSICLMIFATIIFPLIEYFFREVQDRIEYLIEKVQARRDKRLWRKYYQKHQYITRQES